MARASGTVERTGLTDFPADGVTRSVRNTVGGHQVTGYPALVDEGTTVGLQVFTSAADQQRAMRAGTRRLLVLVAPGQVGQLRQSLTREQLLTLAVTPYGTVGSLVADATEAAVDALLDWAGGPAWTADGFAALRAKIAPHLSKAVRDVMVAGEQALRAAQAAAQAIDTAARAVSAGAIADLLADMRDQLETSLAPGFVDQDRRRGPARPDQAAPGACRPRPAGGGRAGPGPGAAGRGPHAAAGGGCGCRSASCRADAGCGRDGRRQMLDEFRVALFAQPMRTAVPVSAKRIRAAVAALRP